MHHLSLSDEVFEAATRQAKEAGFNSVEDYLADLVHHNDSGYDPEDLDSRFTPKVIEALDRAAAEVEAGHCYTVEEVRESLTAERKAWLDKNGR